MEILVLAEAPGEQEDKKNIQLIGPAGQVLREVLGEFGVDLDLDCRKTNAVRCRPPENRKPTNQEIAACNPHIWDEIKANPPKLILILGQVAMESFLLGRGKKASAPIGQWRGFAIPDQKAKAWVCPTYHPSYILRAQQGRAIRGKSIPGKSIEELTFERDLENALTHLKMPFPIAPSPVTNAVPTIPDEEVIAIDYETTGLRPWQNKDHRIVTYGVACGRECMAFPMTSQNAREWKKILADPAIKKVGHNIKFEHQWAQHCLGVETKGWVWDTMLAAHMIDNRSAKDYEKQKWGICSLKLQAYLNFGAEDWSIRMADVEDENGLVNTEVTEELLRYNALDAFWTYQLYLKQKDQPGLKGYQLFHEATLALANVEATGINVDVSYLKTQYARLDKEMLGIENDLWKTEEAEDMKTHFHDKTNFSSPTQLSRMLFKEWGHKPTKATERGNAAVDDEVLRKIGTPFTENILKLRKLIKVKDTYIAGLLRERIGSFLHPSFNLHTAVTFRSSCDSPNFQNMPIRDPMQGKTVRTAFIPYKAEDIFGEIDFKGMEVTVAACYHKDPVMLDYLNDKSKDMHRDNAAECFMLKPGQVGKMIRYVGKNGFTFPIFYGSYFLNIGPAMWDAVREYKLTTEDGIPLYDHLRSKGIKSVEDFTDHIQDVEDNFWKNRFKVYAQWKKDWYAIYLEKGYFDLLSGFRCQGPMRKNEACNYPVQGAAFHCMLWVLIQTHRWLVANEMKSCIIGQIHDSIVFNFDADEMSEILKKVHHIATVALPKHWPWIVAPMEIEVEVAPPGRPWNEKEKVTI